MHDFKDSELKQQWQLLLAVHTYCRCTVTTAAPGSLRYNFGRGFTLHTFVRSGKLFRKVR